MPTTGWPSSRSAARELAARGARLAPAVEAGAWAAYGATILGALAASAALDAPPAVDGLIAIVAVPVAVTGYRHGTWAGAAASVAGLGLHAAFVLAIGHDLASLAGREVGGALLVAAAGPVLGHVGGVVRALREDERRLREMTEAIGEVFWIENARAGRVDLVSAAYARVWGRPVEDLLAGRASWLDGVHPADRAPIAGALARLRETGRPVTIAFRVVRPDGSVRSVRCRASAAFDAKGVIARVVGVAEDVTARREPEHGLAERERLDALGAAAASVAHELNNPLAYVRGHVELAIETLRDALDSTALTPSARESLVEVARGQKAALKGIDRMTAISVGLRRLVSGASRTFAIMDLNEVVAEAVEVAAAAPPPGVRIACELRTSRPIRADAVAVGQAVVNLVRNAVEAVATPGGAVSVVARDEGDGVVVEVRDTGPGLSPEVRRRLFTPFATTKPEGTGLGLCITKRIAVAHRGALAFESEEGVGTAFRLWLPCEPGPPARAAAWP